METKIVLIVLIVVILVILARCVRVVQQSKAYVIERLGAFHTVWSVGLHFKVPFIDRVLRVVSLKEQVADFPPQPVITKDNVTMQIDTVLYYQITDPKLFAYGVENPMNAIENLTATTLRNIIGELELDQSLTSRDIINARMRSILDEATDPWGIKVNRVELKNILPPKDIQNAMEKQMRAERERREQILQAEGQKQSQILVAEGEKESRILRADGEKQARIMEAEAEAAAILRVNEAMANSLKLLNESNPTDPVIRFKALEAFQAAANGKATKIIIPSEIQGLAGLAEGIVETVRRPDTGRAAPGPGGPKAYFTLYATIKTYEKIPLSPTVTGGFNILGGLQGQRGGGVGPGGHLSVQRIQPFHIRGEKVETPQQVVGVLLFLALLLYKPIQELQGAEIIGLHGLSIDGVDEGGDILLVDPRGGQRIAEGLIYLVRGVDGAQLGALTVVLEIGQEEHSVVSLLLSLNLKPVTEPIQVLGVVVIGHIQVQVGGIKFLVDLLL